jgi:hypothetical protein
MTSSISILNTYLLQPTAIISAVIKTGKNFLPSLDEGG